MDASFSPTGYVDAVSELDWQMWMDYATDQQRSPRDLRHPCGNPGCPELTEALFCSEVCREQEEGPDHEPCDEETYSSVLPVVAPLPEARASINVRLMLHGHDCQLTLRDHDEAALLDRLVTVLERFPVEASPPTQAPAGKDWCQVHRTSMKEQHGKDGSTWYSHKTPDGWCKGRKGGSHG